MVAELTTVRGIAASTVADAAAGDADALARIVGAHHDDMARICYVICGDQDMAQDAVQAAWPVAWRKLGSRTGQRQLTHSSVDGSMRFAEPKWTPGGTQILVSVATGPPGSGSVTVNDVQIGIVDAAGGEPVLFSPTIHGSRPDMRPTP